MNKGLIYGLGGVSLALVVGGTIMYIKNRQNDDVKETPSDTTDKSKSSKSSSSSLDLNSLAKSLNSKVLNNIVTVTFNSKKNKIQFYSNGRFSINDSTTKKLIKKGTWSDGGKKLTPDGGKAISSSSVWGNIEKTI
jgi:hypothetical protein